jgi:hypothetical protein
MRVTKIAIVLEMGEWSETEKNAIQVRQALFSIDNRYSPEIKGGLINLDL